MQGFITRFVSLAFEVYYWLIIARIIISWVRVDPAHPLVEFVYRATEPVLAPFRSLIPSGGMRIDFSPLIALLVLSLARRFILQILYTLAI